MKINAKKLILGLLVAADGKPLGAPEAVAACAVFGISENGARVALTRLSAEAMIESAGRGTYRLGPSAEKIGAEVSEWRRSEERLRRWRGDYLVAHTGTLGRRNRKELRRRERALEIAGFRELERGLHIRPNNLDRVNAVRERLWALGLEKRSKVFVADGFRDEEVRAIGELWDRAALDAHYVQDRSRLEEWMERASELDSVVAARESYILGNQAIRSLVFDPWLPAPLVDVEARHAYFEAVRRFDDFGKAIWSRFVFDFKHLPIPHTAIHPATH